MTGRELLVALLVALAIVLLALAIYVRSERKPRQFRACPTYPHRPVVFVLDPGACPTPSDVAAA